MSKRGNTLRKKKSRMVLNVKTEKDCSCQIRKKKKKNWAKLFKTVKNLNALSVVCVPHLSYFIASRKQTKANRGVYTQTTGVRKTEDKIVLLVLAMLVRFQ